MIPSSSVVVVLARAFVNGEQTIEHIALRANAALGIERRWPRAVAKRYLKNWEGRTRPRLPDVCNFLHDDSIVAWNLDKLHVAQWLTSAPVMHPAPVAKNWPIPPIETTGALAGWLSIAAADLAWFADLKGLGYQYDDRPRLRHYRYRVVTKRLGGIRLVESPKPRLKAIQRQILSQILNQMPLHDQVHGFRKGRSIVTFAKPHAGRDVVLRMDLSDFFPSISGPRVQTFFRTAGYPEDVADLLGGLCTNATPAMYGNALTITPCRPNMRVRTCRKARPLPPRLPTSVLIV